MAVAKKKAKRARKPVVKRPPRKASVKTVKALAKKSARGDAKLKKTDSKLKGELSRLQAELVKLKKNPRAKKRELNSYTLFMKKQLKAGKNFRQSVAAWNRFKKLQNKRKPSAYNSFIASQLKQGRTFKQAVALWKSLKSGRKPKAKIIVKRIVRRQKPKIVTRTRIIRAKPRVVTRTRIIRQKPKIVTRTRIVEKPIVFPKIEEKQVEEQKSGQTIVLPEKIVHILEQNTLKESSQGLPLEEISYRLLSIYFEEMARHGLKRSVSLDELVSIYLYLIKKIEERLGKQQKSLLHEEEVAYRLVKLYVLELARFGKKRTTNLDELAEEYFFVLTRIAPALKTG